MGAMRFDDDAFCQEIYALLQSQLGVSIKEIGDVDVSHLLYAIHRLKSECDSHERH